MKIKHLAIFLDFDGTLVELSPTPGAVVVDKKVTHYIDQFPKATEGAFAFITGRDQQSLFSLAPAEPIICACEHGSDIIIPPNPIYHDLRRKIAVVPPHEELESILAIKSEVASFARKHQLLSESKKFSSSLHYRQYPQLETEVKEFARSLVVKHPQYLLLFGKSVVEIRFSLSNKGSAIASLMQSPPFLSKTPLFIGDDVTDEDGFRIVNQHHGISIKVGEGSTIAQQRLADVTAVQNLLDTLLMTGELPR